MSHESPLRRTRSIRTPAVKVRFMTPVLPQSSETKQESRVYVNEYGQTIKMRKKPGRKPNPAPPAMRREQNRVAQRAFRKRKEKHLHDLENNIRTLREQRNRAIKELGQQKKANDATNVKNWYLTGLALTLHFIYMYNNIPIPAHTPYLSKENQDEIAKASPCAIKTYLDVVRRNNASLDSAVADDFLDDPEESPLSFQEQRSAQTNGDPNPLLVGTKSNKKITRLPNLDGPKKSEEKQKDEEADKEREAGEEGMTKTPLSGTSLIQWIRMYLRVQTLLDVIQKSRTGLGPTLLQLTIRHDPRIDLIPLVHVRDRLIIFSHLVNYDEFFEMLLTKASYRGGDITTHAGCNLP
ncbi:hypothetical protein DFQ28_000659 [Apophysomyces sp. BC1034]|nr:hypothetical protein DFQ30_000666 [Apophysomyces sp. BC1015]KAG0179389.1 hypothetical protein DFQ29_002143 [Apophysomyces sp. BC1021]KAG0179395.1 hypothetical protein DFQ29_002149 [Apophysomyces sp. BC1021]KAG0191264.1 hypothetical protein DFQ28_000659 [Apophysomyces sp. BC1034]